MPLFRRIVCILMVVYLSSLKITFAILSHAGMRGVWCHVLCGGRHRHNNDRDGDSLLSCRDNRYCYADRTWWLLLFYLHLHLFDIWCEVFDYFGSLRYVAFAIHKMDLIIFFYCGLQNDNEFTVIRKVFCYNAPI